MNWVRKTTTSIKESDTPQGPCGPAQCFDWFGVCYFQVLLGSWPAAFHSAVVLAGPHR